TSAVIHHRTPKRAWLRAPRAPTPSPISPEAPLTEAPRMSRSLLPLLLLAACASPARADWKPGKAPLMTRWAKDVSPDKALPEYPGPRLAGRGWPTPTGLWQRANARADEAAPAGKDLPQRILVPFPVESALSGVMKRAERLWYRRTFT